MVRAYPLPVDGRGRRAHLDPYGHPVRTVVRSRRRRCLRPAAHTGPGVRLRRGDQDRLRVLPIRGHGGPGRRLACPPGRRPGELFGNTIVNAKTDGGVPVDLTLFGIRPGSFLEPSVAEGTPIGGDTDVVLSDSARDTGVELGDTVVVDRLGTRLTVVGFTSDKRTFGHVDVAYLPLNTWQEIHAGVRLGEQVPPSAYTEASVVAIEGVGGTLPDLAAGDAEAGTAAKTLEESFDASPGYSAEMMTMSMIIAFLYAISALVVGAFFTIWTVQRSREIAVLRAMGASTGFLLRDSLLQAVIVLVGSVAVGVLIGLGLGSGLEGSGMPFVLETGPIVQGAVLLVVLGLVGAALAVTRIVRVDPLAALGENR